MRAYKQLKVNEWAFRQMKAPLEIRPLHHRKEDRVRAHVFLCMLACYVQFELAQRLAPMLLSDDTPLSPADPVAPAKRSPRVIAKAGSARTGVCSEVIAQSCLQQRSRQRRTASTADRPGRYP